MSLCKFSILITKLKFGDNFQTCTICRTVISHYQQAISIIGDFLTPPKKGGEDMKISHYLGIAIVLLAVNTAMATNQVTISADVICPIANSLTFPDQVLNPDITIPNTWNPIYTGLIQVGGCGPWSVSVTSDKDDGKMTSGALKLGTELQVKATPQSTGNSDGWIVPTTTAKRIAYDYGNYPEWFDGELYQPTAFTDVDGRYGMVLTFTYARTV